jgi:hypothetical protein
MNYFEQAVALLERISKVAMPLSMLLLSFAIAAFMFKSIVG